MASQPLNPASPSEPPQAAFFALPNTEFLESGLYRALDVERKEIRVLRFLPSSTENDLQLELVERHLSLLEDTVAFTALSYAAGDLRKTASININGIAFETFQSLENALKRLFAGFADRVFWADQICINQHDLVEKSSQVLLMGDIYRAASSTLIHMGQFDASGKIHELVNAVWSGADFLPNPLPPDVVSSDYDEDDASVWQEVGEFAQGPLLQILRDVSADEAFRALTELFGHSWWSRSWCQQELILSQEPIILIGQEYIHWRQLERMFELLKELPWQMEDPGQAASPEEQLDFDIFRSWRSVLDTVGYQRYQNLMYLRRFNLDFAGSDLSRLLTGARNLLSTDLRDRIYALLGLTDKNYHIEPNYHPSYTFAEALTDAYQAVITTEGSLETITEADMWRTDRISGLPSWVPDLTKPDDEHMAPLLSNSTHGLPQETSFKEVTYQGNLYRTLQMSVILLGPTFDGVTLLEHVDNVEQVLLQQSLDTWFDFLQSCSLTQNSETACDKLVSEFCKTVSFGNLWQIEALKKYLTSDGDFQEVLNIFDYQSRTRTLPLIWTIFCMPMPGDIRADLEDMVPLIGLTPIDTLPGDQLCLVPTVSVPVVLRPSTILASDVPTYTMVGRAYSPAFKDSEAAQKGIETGVLKYEKVCLI